MRKLCDKSGFLLIDDEFRRHGPHREMVVHRNFGVEPISSPAPRHSPTDAPGRHDHCKEGMDWPRVHMATLWRKSECLCCFLATSDLIEKLYCKTQAVVGTTRWMPWKKSSPASSIGDVSGIGFMTVLSMSKTARPRNLPSITRRVSTSPLSAGC